MDLLTLAMLKKMQGGSGGGSGGGGSEAVELLFESTFTVAESITTANVETALVTINTGLTQNEVPVGADLYAVMVCINDTETDTSFNHVKARTQNPMVGTGGYGSNQVNSGISYSVQYTIYGSSFGLYIKDFGKYASSITIYAKGHGTHGYVASGDYSFKLYKMKQDFFGLEGI